MNSSPKLATVSRLLFAVVVCAIALGLLFKAGSHPATAQADQVSQSSTSRSFENTVPEHLPIKVKIRKEKEDTFKDLANENWVRDLEIEVKNTGDKPIYYLDFGLEVPETKLGNGHQLFTITYGRVELSDSQVRPNADDIPIRPGEVVILKIKDLDVRGWEAGVRAGLVPSLIHRVQFLFQHLSFGDGTGFEGTSGVAWPRVHNKTGPTTWLKAPEQPRTIYELAFPQPRVGNGTRKPGDPKHAGKFQPASFLARNFSGFLSLGSIRSAFGRTGLRLPGWL